MYYLTDLASINPKTYIRSGTYRISSHVAVTYQLMLMPTYWKRLIYFFIYFFLFWNNKNCMSQAERTMSSIKCLVSWWTSLPPSEAWKLTYSKDKLRSFLFISKCFSRIGLCPTCSLNKWFCTAFVSTSCNDYLAPLLLFQKTVTTILLWPPCSHIFISRGHYD